MAFWIWYLLKKNPTHIVQSTTIVLISDMKSCENLLQPAICTCPGPSWWEHGDQSCHSVKVQSTGASGLTSDLLQFVQNCLQSITVLQSQSFCSKLPNTLLTLWTGERLAPSAAVGSRQSKCGRLQKIKFQICSNKARLCLGTSKNLFGLLKYTPNIYPTLERIASVI